MPEVTTILSALGGLVLLVGAFFLGRVVESANSTEAKQARLTQVALAAVTQLKALRNPPASPDLAAATAKEAQAIADLKAMISSVT